jgi:hypothetical protein
MNQSKKIFAKKPGSAGLLFFVPVLHRGLRTKFLRIVFPPALCRKAGLRIHRGRYQLMPPDDPGCFENKQSRLRHNVHRATGLPCSDEQKKSRLRSHLSA